jgi:hypothetical protein
VIFLGDAEKRAAGAATPFLIELIFHR